MRVYGHAHCRDRKKRKRDSENYRATIVFGTRLRLLCSSTILTGCSPRAYILFENNFLLQMEGAYYGLAEHNVNEGLIRYTFRADPTLYRYNANEVNHKDLCRSLRLCLRKLADGIRWLTQGFVLKFNINFLK